ncbi:MAG: SDR family oxidoreductase, partial [Gammaproteobacteria bacterium]|nr:SDR family oxidoreductase [Gammaproteobacteria bacterium]
TLGMLQAGRKKTRCFSYPPGRTLSRLEQTVAAIEAAGGRGCAVAADCATEAGADAVLDAAECCGPVAVLVNNAGVGYSFEATRPGSMAALVDTTPENWHEVMRINLDSAYFMCRRALPGMIAAGGGAIVNVSSAGGTQGMADAHAYATSKAGMINLTRSLARAYGPNGIRANVLAPGFVATDMVASVLESEANPFADDTLRFAACPLGRPGEPEEMAEAIVFLACNGYANGAVLVLDGGSTC